jgi:hypothetical protein
MELTKSGIPASLRFAFQEYDLEQLDLAADAFIIIERTLAYGSRAEVRWLFANYGRQKLLDWLTGGGWRTLPRLRRQLWATYFELDPFPTQRGIWPH